MFKQILKLKGAQEISKEAQKSLTGGGRHQDCGDNCMNTGGCVIGTCVNIWCDDGTPWGGQYLGSICVPFSPKK